jgi:hypothetical protein
VENISNTEVRFLPAIDSRLEVPLEDFLVQTSNLNSLESLLSDIYKVTVPL